MFLMNLNRPHEVFSLKSLSFDRSVLIKIVVATSESFHQHAARASS